MSVWYDSVSSAYITRTISENVRNQLGKFPNQNSPLVFPSQNNLTPKIKFQSLSGIMRLERWMMMYYETSPDFPSACSWTDIDWIFIFISSLILFHIPILHLSFTLITQRYEINATCANSWLSTVNLVPLISSLLCPAVLHLTWKSMLVRHRYWSDISIPLNAAQRHKRGDKGD